MKLNRRKLFGVAAGAVAAAPAVAQQMGTTALPPGPPTRFRDAEYNLDKAGCPAEDPNWKIDRLAKLKRIAAGDIPDEDKNWCGTGQIDRYEPLRAMSEAAKQFSRDRRIERDARARMIAHALDCLNHYDQTGILRSFF